MYESVKGQGCSACVKWLRCDGPPLGFKAKNLLTVETSGMKLMLPRGLILPTLVSEYHLVQSTTMFYPSIHLLEERWGKPWTRSSQGSPIVRHLQPIQTHLLSNTHLNCWRHTWIHPSYCLLQEEVHQRRKPAVPLHTNSFKVTDSFCFPSPVYP